LGSWSCEAANADNCSVVDGGGDVFVADGSLVDDHMAERVVIVRASCQQQIEMPEMSELTVYRLQCPSTQAGNCLLDDCSHDVEVAAFVAELDVVVDVHAAEDTTRSF